ncbi:type II toxin-antitoxin system RelE/ParE family toxin [Flavobacterium psychroterrae]|uniref:Toxin n=1 Tax=Flavobacterium psychroterrae TaxID=2133767 RepID=A0ABS5PEQ4_9FLAO|nr:type II toxin-antitoxin system RelE/ParE family toxin [Flavobacterium psychroterrae]MBS7232764.1 type II toxin-antitoxin system RelE/ParE family toxin [Flavobacterium psychroterrae]
MAKYFLTNKAVDDLSKIWNYSYEVWSEKQADKYYNELLGDCHELAKNQNLGKIYSEIYKDLFGYKSGEHIIFYKILNTKEIEIIRFLHSAMNLRSRIRE